MRFEKARQNAYKVQGRLYNEGQPVEEVSPNDLTPRRRRLASSSIRSVTNSTRQSAERTARNKDHKDGSNIRKKKEESPEEAWPQIGKVKDQPKDQKTTTAYRDKAAVSPAAKPKTQVSTASPAKTPAKKPVSPPPKKNDQDTSGGSGSSGTMHVNKQIDEDYLLAISMQQKLNAGVDVAVAAPDAKAQKKADKTAQDTGNNDLNKKAEPKQNATVGIRSATQPGLQNAAPCKPTPAAQALKETKSDEGIYKPSQDTKQEIILPNISPCDTQSSGDGPTPPTPRRMQQKLTAIWNRRSKRWSHLFQKLLSLPSKQIETVGYFHFSFADESLFIAKGYL